MSFILDALKKSELERQRQNVPGLVDSGAARPRPRLPAWAIALGLLLAVNLLVLLFVLTRSFLASPHAPATVGKESQSVQTPAIAAPAAGNGDFSPLDTPVYAPEVPVAPPRPASASFPAPDVAKPVNGG